MDGNAAIIARAGVQLRRVIVSLLAAVVIIQSTFAESLRAQDRVADLKQSVQPEGSGSVPDPNGETDNAVIQKQSAPASVASPIAQVVSEPLVPVAIDPSLNGESSGSYGPASPAPAKPEQQLPSLRFGVIAQDVPALGLPALDHAIYLQEDAQNPAGCKKMRVSVGRDLPMGPDDGRWTTLPGVGQLWTADIVSQGALGIRVHFTQMNLPAGAMLFVYSPAQPEYANGPYQTVGPVGDGQFWAASVEGEQARIELFIPDEGVPAKPAAAFRIDMIQHYYRNPMGAAQPAGDDQANPHGGGCHNDVSCHSAWTNVSHSVARIDYVDGSGGHLCTGQLLNPQNGDVTPYFLTANHCIDTNAAAQTIQFYWFYQSSTCNGAVPSLGSVPKSLVGTLLSNSAATDYSLIMVEGALPCGVFWNGWTSGAIPNGEASVGVHHPGGQPTKISFATRATADNSFCSSGNPNFVRENWSDGITEGGSSGSGIYRTSDQRLYGQLFCGPSNCGPGGVTYDNYGAFARTYADNAAVQTFLAGGSDDAFEPNDSCATAFTVSEGVYSNRVVRSSREDWYRINVPGGGTLAVSLAFVDANGDVDVQLYGSCGGSVLASSTGVTDTEFFAYTNTGGAANFLVRVYLGDCDTRNNYNINLSASLENDACTTATIIPSNATSYNPAVYSTVAANASGAEPQESCESGNVGVSNTVWYAFTPCGNGTISINTIGSNYDTVLSVFTGSCGSATQVACNDDIVSGNLQSQLTNVAVSAGVTYLIKVADYGSPGGGNLDLNFSYAASAPGNDLCANAVVIPNGLTFNPAPYCTIGATNSGGDVVESCGFSPNSNSVWYRFTPCGHGSISVDTNGSDYDTVVSVFFGACGAAVEIACDDDAGTGANSQLTAVPVAAGVTYLIKVSDYNTPDGGTLDFNFSYAPVVPANDSCGSPAVIPGSPGVYNPLSYCTTGADATLFEPQESCESGNVGVSNSVWYSFTPCASGTISLDTIGSDYDTVLSVFTGLCTGAVQVACDDDAGGNLASQLVNVPVTKNTSYLIKVADYSTPNGGTLVFHFTFTAGAPVFLGDMNCDGCVTPADVQAMVLALLNPGNYAATYPGCSILRGDTNGDSLVNGRDIRGFTNLVMTP